MSDQFADLPLKQMIIMDTPLGHISCSSSVLGLVSLSFFSNETASNPEVYSQNFKLLKNEILSYFKGSKVTFSTAVDLSGLSEFQRDVLAACREISYGEVKTYGDLAKLLGKPGAAQAVGGALARNPIPLIIPCHRVVAANGSLHGYSAAGGLDTKKYLLTLERVNLSNF